MGLMMSYKLALSFFLFVVGHWGIWYCHNSQLVWEFWRERWILPTFVFGVPASFAFWWGTKFMMECVDTLWTVRFSTFALSYLTFPILTWWHLGESPFTLKTLICTILAIGMISTQFLLK